MAKYSTYQNLDNKHQLHTTAVFDGEDWKIRFTSPTQEEPIYLLHYLGTKVRTFKSLDSVAHFIGKNFPHFSSFTVVSEKNIEDYI